MYSEFELYSTSELMAILDQVERSHRILEIPRITEVRAGRGVGGEVEAGVHPVSRVRRLLDCRPPIGRVSLS